MDAAPSKLLEPPTRVAARSSMADRCDRRLIPCRCPLADAQEPDTEALGTMSLDSSCKCE